MLRSLARCVRSQLGLYLSVFCKIKQKSNLLFNTEDSAAHQYEAARQPKIRTAWRRQPRLVMYGSISLSSKSVELRISINVFFRARASSRVSRLSLQSSAIKHTML